MRISLFFSLLTLAACNGSDTATGDDDDDDGGGNQNHYGQEFEDKYCDEWAACSGETGCPLTTSDPPPGATPPSTTTAECNFDQQAADDCLSGDWQCLTVGGYSIVLPAPACCAVCGGEPCPTAPM